MYSKSFRRQHEGNKGRAKTGVWTALPPVIAKAKYEFGCMMDTRRPRTGKKRKFSSDCFFFSKWQSSAESKEEPPFIHWGAWLYIFRAPGLFPPTAFVTDILYNHWCDRLSNGHLLHNLGNFTRPGICHSPLNHQQLAPVCLLGQTHSHVLIF